MEPSGIYDLDTLQLELSALGYPALLSEIPVFRQNWSTFDDADYDQLDHAGYRRYSHSFVKTDHTNLFQGITAALTFKDMDSVTIWLKKLFSGTCGSVIRVKGFIKLADNEVYSVNCTPSVIEIHPTKASQNIVNILGSHMKRKMILEEAAPGHPPF